MRENYILFCEQHYIDENVSINCVIVQLVVTSVQQVFEGPSDAPFTAAQ